VSKLIPFTVRLPAAHVRALDARTDRSRQSRNELIGEAVELWMSLEAQRELVARTVREATQQALREIQEASKQTDATNRQLILDFIEALTSDTVSQAPDTNERMGYVRLPETNRR
jgi:metal-responsive CopG/Arc/MetJ family transcriptional regulator